MSGERESAAREVLARHVKVHVSDLDFTLAGERDAVIAAMLEYADREREAMREACVSELERRAETARVAAIGGGMDPSDASLIDYEMSHAADAIRNFPITKGPQG